MLKNPQDLASIEATNTAARTGKAYRIVRLPSPTNLIGRAFAVIKESIAHPFETSVILETVNKVETRVL